jgi:NAD(P)-dependent dehydrogenase (short-subunit alcohol dehydrogenase family)
MNTNNSMKPLALITGGHTGIGLGIARELVNAGYAIAVVAESPIELDTVQATLGELGANAHYYQHDLRDVSNVPTLLDQIEAEQGAVQSLISNAGVSALVRGDMLDMKIDSYDFVVDVNLKGTFFLAQEVARRMISQTDKIYRSMVFITSVNAEMVSKERAEYCISKAGAAMMAKLFADRLGPEGIGVFDLRPGIIETRMAAVAKDKYDAKISEGLVPAGRWGQPSDIGSVVLPLVQGKMAYASGAVIPVDGGLSINRL